MIRIVALGLLLLFVVWGATRPPGRPFSWTMFSGSSKAFLWEPGERGPRFTGADELRLAPDAHYLSPAELDRLCAGSRVPIRVEGLVISSWGNWFVSNEGDPRHIRVAPLQRDRALALLAARLKQLECPPSS
jgi:hypothetical protein